MKHPPPAIRYSQLKYEPPARRVGSVNFFDGFWWLLFKYFVSIILSSCVSFLRRRPSLRGRLFALIAVLLLALLPPPKPAHAYQDPIIPISSQTALKQAVEPTKLVEQAPVSVIFAWPNTYAGGNCTFFVASKVPVPDSLGNANTWAIRAAEQGYTVSTVPKIGAVAQTSAGALGHVAIVRDIQGSQVLIEEMNSLGLGVIDSRWVPISSYVYIYFV